MITKDDIRSILAGDPSLGLPEDLPDDRELVIDSFTLVLLQHALEERHGLAIDPQFEDMALFTSIDGIHRYLTQVLGARPPQAPGEA
ncbi:acyl carrier protein [Kitasatospora sp. NPDC054939]